MRGPGTVSFIAGGIRQVDNTSNQNEIIVPAVVQVDVSIRPEAVQVGKPAALFVVVEIEGVRYIFVGCRLSNSDNLNELIYNAEAIAFAVI